MTTPSKSQAIPQTQILAYLTKMDSATRVRRISATALHVSAVLYTLPAIILCALAVRFIFEGHLYWSPYFGDMLWDYFRYQFLRNIAAMFALSCGFLLIAIVRPVRQGHSRACFLAIILLVPLQLAVISYTAISAGFGVVDALTVIHPSYVHLLNLLIIIPASPIFLLLLDLQRCLRWIARNPFTEKPPTPFLPTAKSDGLPHLHARAQPTGAKKETQKN